MRISTQARDAGFLAISVLVFGGLWQLVGLLKVSPAIPPLTDVLIAMVDVAQDRRFQEAAANTGVSVIMTFVPVVVIGVLVGVAMGSSKWFEWIGAPYVNMSLAIPLVSLIPVFLLIFGLGRPTIIAVIVAYALPAVIVNTQAGIESVDADQRAMARSVGAGRLLTFRRITLPSSAALIMSGVRVAAGRAIKGSIIAEQIIGLVGLGGLIQRFGGAFAVENLYAVILYIGIVGILVVWLLGLAERRLGGAR